MLPTLLRPLRTLLRAILALLIAFEEWGWAPLAAWLGRLLDRPLLRRLEAAIARLPPGAALAVLLAPALLLLPVKLGALWLLGQGRAWWGLGLIIAAKLLGTALVARLFGLVQPSLLRMPWFARGYARWSGWKAELLGWLHATSTWRWMSHWRRRLKRGWRRGSGVKTH